jgi:hypothetical protein
LAFGPLQIFLLNQDVDTFLKDTNKMLSAALKKPQLVEPYLDDVDPRLETGRQLIEDLGQQLLMLEDFAHFHDAHDGCLDKQFAIFLQVTLRGLLLLFQLGLHGNVDVDSQLLAANQSHERKSLLVVVLCKFN